MKHASGVLRWSSLQQTTKTTIEPRRNSGKEETQAKIQTPGQKTSQKPAKKLVRSSTSNAKLYCQNTQTLNNKSKNTHSTSKHSSYVKSRGVDFPTTWFVHRAHSGSTL